MIPHSRPFIDDEDAREVQRVLLSGQLAQDGEVARFESRMASFVGVRGAVAVSSGSAALQLALMALKVGPGDEVLVPSYVCPAVLNAVLHTGASPVVADIEPATFNLSAGDAMRRITPKTRAVIVPHMFGQPADLDALGALGVPVVEDLAMSLGSRRRGKRAGGFGSLAVCSFYATKMMATGEGGMVLGGDEALLAEVRDLRAMDEKEEFRVRFNCKMTDLQAALGLSQLRKLAGFIARRREIADLYGDTLRRLSLPAPPAPAECEPVWYRYVLMLDGDAEPFIEEMKRRGVECRRPVYKPLHRYLRLSGFEASEEAWRRAVSVPLYPALSVAEVETIVKALRLVLPRHCTGREQEKRTLGQASSTC
ncbi:MAG: DegT/DnrJ/EryC1/StrS family aminotransferase [Syntrophales bacterium]|nr:DegT/DnrJ/EryC1/StrS family aminotransferase [Syntrophales bacterium]